MSGHAIDELIILGGCKGVGKTTLAKLYCDETRTAYRHPGDWFLKYLGRADTHLLEGMALHDIITATKPVLVDLHYKTYVKPHGYRDGLRDESLALLAQEYPRIALYLVEISPDELYKRRKKDGKKRKLELDIIAEELRQNKLAFEHFRQQLGNSCSTAEIIVNRTLEESLKALLSQVKPLPIFT